MLTQQGVFDASGSAPPSQEGAPKHPVGKFPFNITGTDIVPNKPEAADPNGFQFVVEFTTPAGKIFRRHNLWNTNAQTVQIGTGELTALCHATGIFRLDLQNNKGRELIGGRGMIEVIEDGKYSRVAKVFDVNGNLPGAAPQQQQPQQTFQPQPQQTFQPQPQPQPASAWPAPQQQQPAPQPAPAPAPAPAFAPSGQTVAQPNWGAPGR